MGFGFRCGFLGCSTWRSFRRGWRGEFDLTSSLVAERSLRGGGRGTEVREITNPSDLPEFFEEIREPVVRRTLICPKEYVGAVMGLCHERAASLSAWSTSRRGGAAHVRLPLAEIITDFFDVLKSRTRGYASFDYEFTGYEVADLVKVEVLVSGEPVDALSIIVHRDKAYYRGRALTEKLKELIPRQQFEVPVQATMGKRVIARETVRAYRKDVTAKCYGGDISRKRKLLEQQKKGKRRMKQVGSVEIPQEAFLAALKL
jgi:GTP-binding protein LepA